MPQPYVQRAFKDTSSDGRRQHVAVVAQFVTDGRPYALTETRLLNASHSALGYLGTRMGHTRLDAVMADDAFSSYIERVMDDEIAPLLPSVGIDMFTYSAPLRTRFANPM